MKTQKRRSPIDMTAYWEILWNRNVAKWLNGEAEWPRSWHLGSPTEREVQADFAGTRQWIAAWNSWADKNDAQTNIHWQVRQWRSLGEQRLPTRIECISPQQLAGWIEKGDAWKRASERFARLTMRFPGIRRILKRYYSVLAHESEVDYWRIEKVLLWLFDNPNSNLFPRQLPIAGLDIKWLDKRRKRQLKDWLQYANSKTTPDDEGDEESTEALIEDNSIDDDRINNDFYTVSGLRPEPAMLSLRVLDPLLRQTVGGLSLLQTPLDEAANISWSVPSVLVVENLTTGWALEDLPGTVAIIGRGYAVRSLASLPWIHSARIAYWGDIDTHGFAILDEFRTVFPQAESLLMDVDSLKTHVALCVEESCTRFEDSFPKLSQSEKVVYTYLKNHPGLRLEQERIAWDYAWPRLQAWAHSCQQNQ